MCYMGIYPNDNLQMLYTLQIKTVHGAGQSYDWLSSTRDVRSPIAKSPKK